MFKCVWQRLARYIAIKKCNRMPENARKRLEMHIFENLSLKMTIFAMKICVKQLKRKLFQ